MQETGNKTNNPYSLSIRFNTDGFSFYICNPLSDRDFSCKHYPAVQGQSIYETLEKELSDNLQIKEWKFTIISALFQGPVCHIPLEYFNKEQRRDFYEFTCGKKNDVRIHYNILPKLEIAELFSVPSDIEKLLVEKFPTIHFYAQNSIVMERTLQYAVRASCLALYLYFYDKKIFIFYYQEKKIVFANEFSISTIQDTLYYVLSVWKELQLDQRHTPCILIQPEQGPEGFIEALGRYVDQLQVINMESWFADSPLSKIKIIPFDILSLLLNGF